MTTTLICEETWHSWLRKDMIWRCHGTAFDTSAGNKSWIWEKLSYRLSRCYEWDISKIYLSLIVFFIAIIVDLDFAALFVMFVDVKEKENTIY